jgi:hypothetical protein
MDDARGARALVAFLVSKLHCEARKSMKTLTICGLIAVALLSAIVLQSLVWPPSGDRPEYGIAHSGLGQHALPQQEITDYSVEFRQESSARPR